MSRVSKMRLPFEEWPGDDRQRWEAAFKPGDLFDDDNRGAHLAEATRNALRVSYAQYLRFISENDKELFSRPPDGRINRKLVAAYVVRLENHQPGFERCHQPASPSSRIAADLPRCRLVMVVDNHKAYRRRGASQGAEVWLGDH
jgi:hypothetical protein